jgi:hypothetical protein
VFRAIKWILVLAFVGTLLSGASYAAARVAVGKIVGPNPPLSGRTVEFSFRGVEELAGNPRAWVVTYAASRLPGVRGATFYVSPTGKLLSTRPADLSRRIEAWEKARQP